MIRPPSRGETGPRATRPSAPAAARGGARPPPQPFGQAAGRKIRHHKVDGAFLDMEIFNWDDVRMPQLEKQASLALEAEHDLRVGCGRSREDLDRDDAVLLRVAGPVDYGHPALADLLHQAVAADCLPAQRCPLPGFPKPRGPRTERHAIRSVQGPAEAPGRAWGLQRTRPRPGVIRPSFSIGVERGG